jgi:hypothetical protein
MHASRLFLKGSKRKSVTSLKKAKAVYGTSNPEDVHRLKVSETRMAVLRKMLACVPGSKLLWLSTVLLAGEIR